MKLNTVFLSLAVIAPNVSAQVSGGLGPTDVCQQSSAGFSMACGGNSLASQSQSVAIGALTRAADGGTSIGVNAGSGVSGTAMGNSATASGHESIAIGMEPGAFGSQAIAIGSGAMATNNGDIAFGANSGASGSASTAVGTGASATGTGSVALGAGSTDAGRNNVVSVGASGATRQVTHVTAGTETTDAVNVGQLQVVEATANTAMTTATNANSTATTAMNHITELDSKAVTYTSSTSTNIVLRPGADGSGTLISNVATGQAAHDAVNLQQLQQTQATIMAAVDSLVKSGACSYVNGRLACGGATAIGNNSVAMGTNALSGGSDAIALGSNSRAAGANSVAIGAGSLAVRANSVSVGNEETGMTRTITGVAAGVMNNDAVNVSQLRSATATTLIQANKYAAQAAARAMSIPTAHISEGRSHAVAVAVGGYDGYSALGATYAYKVDDDASVQLGVATGGSGFAGRATVNFSW